MTNMADESYTRYIYGPNQLYVQSFTTVNDLELPSFTRSRSLTGTAELRGMASEHPGSVGGYKAQIFEYDNMGRQASANQSDGDH